MELGKFTGVGDMFRGKGTHRKEDDRGSSLDFWNIQGMRDKEDR